MSGALLALGVLVPAVRFATTYPGFAPNGGDAMVELRDHLTVAGGMPDARVWADWGTQRILPVYQTSPIGTPRWEARSFRSLNRLLRFPPDSDAAYPQPGDYVVIYSDEDRTCWHCRRALQPVEKAFGAFLDQGGRSCSPRQPATSRSTGWARPWCGPSLPHKGDPPLGGGRGRRPGGSPVGRSTWSGPPACSPPTAGGPARWFDQGTTAVRSSTDSTSGAFVAVLE